MELTGHQSLVSTVGCDPLRDEAELVLGKCDSQLGRISYVPDSGIGVEISLDSIFVGLLRVAILRSLLLLSFFTMESTTCLQRL